MLINDPMRIIEPVAVLAILTIGTYQSWRSRAQLTVGARASIMRIGVGLCTMSTLLAYFYYWCAASIYGLHRATFQFDQPDHASIVILQTLSFAGALMSFLTALCAIVGKPGAARRWCVGIGPVMTLLWLCEGLGLADILAVGGGLRWAGH